jgi:hypothetical protein
MSGLVPSESSTCPNCSATLLPEQRYCLSCGQPASPARLAFLDVLQAEHQQPHPSSSPFGGTQVAVAYPPYADWAGGSGWLRRYTPLFGLLSVLLLMLIAGLLVGHWVTQSKASSAPEVVKIEGALAAAPTAAAPADTTPAGTTPAPAAANKTAGKSSTSAKSEEEKETAEAKAEEKAEEKAPAKAPPPAKDSAEKVSKLEKTTGKAKEKEVSKITTAPIEVK